MSATNVDILENTDKEVGKEVLSADSGVSINIYGSEFEITDNFNSRCVDHLLTEEIINAVSDEIYARLDWDLIDTSYSKNKSKYKDTYDIRLGLNKKNRKNLTKPILIWYLATKSSRGKRFPNGKINVHGAVPILCRSQRDKIFGNEGRYFGSQISLEGKTGVSRIVLKTSGFAENQARVSIMHPELELFLDKLFAKDIKNQFEVAKETEDKEEKFISEIYEERSELVVEPDQQLVEDKVSVSGQLLVHTDELETKSVSDIMNKVSNRNLVKSTVIYNPKLYTRSIFGRINYLGNLVGEKSANKKIIYNRFFNYDLQRAHPSILSSLIKNCNLQDKYSDLYLELGKYIKNPSEYFNNLTGFDKETYTIKDFKKIINICMYGGNPYNLVNIMSIYDEIYRTEEEWRSWYEECKVNFLGNIPLIQLLTEQMDKLVMDIHNYYLSTKNTVFLNNVSNYKFIKDKCKDESDYPKKLLAYYLQGNEFYWTSKFLFELRDLDKNIYDLQVISDEHDGFVLKYEIPNDVLNKINKKVNELTGLELYMCRKEF